MSAFYPISTKIQNELVQFLRDLVAIPSLSGQEGPVILRAKEEMEKLGFDEIKIDPLGNLIGRIGNGPRCIAFDGHIDVVDVGERAHWDTDPFDPVVKDGKIFGRGTTDMKGGVAASIYGAWLFAQKKVPENLSVYVTATVQEEDCDGMCWHFLLKENILRPDIVVITEPTSCKIYTGHRGRMELEVSTTGLSCHGSAPERGVNAIYKMADILKEIETLNESLSPREPLGKGTVTISQIRSISPSLCAVADGCTIHLDRRLTIGESEGSVMKELYELPSIQKAEALVKVLQYETPSYTGMVYPFRKYFPTWYFSGEEPHVQIAQQAYENTFDAKPELGHWTFSTNGIATAGLHSVPTVGFGPGHEPQAHAPNEYLEIDQLVRAAAYYAGFAEVYAKSL